MIANEIGQIECPTPSEATGPAMFVALEAAQLDLTCTKSRRRRMDNYSHRTSEFEPPETHRLDYRWGFVEAAEWVLDAGAEENLLVVEKAMQMIKSVAQDHL